MVLVDIAFSKLVSSVSEFYDVVYVSTIGTREKLVKLKLHSEIV